jgi:hypothetical protein
MQLASTRNPTTRFQAFDSREPAPLRSVCEGQIDRALHCGCATDAELGVLSSASSGTRTTGAHPLPAPPMARSTWPWWASCATAWALGGAAAALAMRGSTRSSSRRCSTARSSRWWWCATGAGTGVAPERAGGCSRDARSPGAWGAATPPLTAGCATTCHRSQRRRSGAGGSLFVRLDYLANAIKRCGELLKAITPAQGGDRGNAATGGRPPIAETRTGAAKQAGLNPSRRRR